MNVIASSEVSIWLLQNGWFGPAPAWHVLVRTAGRKLGPPRAVFEPLVRRRELAVLGEGAAEPRHRAVITCDASRGPTPTIVLGGFVPDASEAVFLLRDSLLRRGSLYYVGYPTSGFHLDLLCAQLDDLVDELAARGRQAVVLGISFGAGLVLEWLRRHRLAGRTPTLRGVVMVSPVACVEDLLPDATAKPTTLLGRAVRPYLDAPGAVDARVVEKSRAMFAMMFDAGDHNRAALRSIMTPGEIAELRAAVMRTIREIDFVGACERVQTLRRMIPPTAYFRLDLLPLCDAPAMILYAEKEDAVIAEGSPTRRAFTVALRAYFPSGEHRLVANPGGTPVQHASLIFHSANFRPVLDGFYRSLRTRRYQLAA